MSRFRNIYDVLVQMNNANPEAIALVSHNKRITTSALLKEVDQLANGLHQRGLKHGDKVGIILSNRSECISFYFALAKNGLVMAPINWKLEVAVLKELVRKQEIKYLVCDNELFDYRVLDEELEILCDFQEKPYTDLLSDAIDNPNKAYMEAKLENSFVILLTSGTSGNPKQIIHTHKTLLLNAEEVVNLLGFNEKDKFLFSSPIYSMFGVGGTLLAFIAHARIVMQQSYTPLKALKIIQEEEITVHSGNMAMFIEELQLLVKTKFDISRLRIGMIGGSVLPESLIREVENKMGMSLCITYGMSENAGAVTIVTPLVPAPQRYRTVGKPLNNTKIKILDNEGNDLAHGRWGEIAIQTPSLCLNVKDSWFRTQDVGYLDSDENLYVVGRKQDIIIRNNNKLSLSLLQAKIINLNGIKMANFEMIGQELVLWVCLKNNCFLSKEKIIHYCEDNFAAHEIPNTVVICKEFPLTGSGKINRMELKKKYMEMKNEV